MNVLGILKRSTAVGESADHSADCSDRGSMEGDGKSQQRENGDYASTSWYDWVNPRNGQKELSRKVETEMRRFKDLLAKHGSDRVA